MKIGLAQINSTLGDFAGNKEKITQYIHLAQEKHCDLVIFPEASLFGYYPVDLLERRDLIDLQLKHLKELSHNIPKDIQIFVGGFIPSPKKHGKPYLNCAILLKKGRNPRFFSKQLLPTFDVFDEGRFIEPGDVTKNSC